MKKTQLYFLALVLAIVAMISLTSQESYASHFRYGHLTYVKNPANTSEVTFTLTCAFRRSSYGAPVVGDLINEFTGATSLIFGDATATGVLNFRVIAIDVANDWLVGRAVDPNNSLIESITHTYPVGGATIFTAEIFSCCRTNLEINNSNSEYRVATIVNTANNNNSPVSTLPTIVNLNQSPASTFFVPAIDSDPDTFLKWRFATLTEMGNVSQNPPVAGGFPATINPVTGLVTWNTTGTVLGGLYSCQVIIEDRSAADTSIIKTRVAVDFLIRINAACADLTPPEFVAPTPACGSVIPATVGVPINFTVLALDDASPVTLNVAGLPPGATMNPSLPQVGDPVSSDFSWTPAIVGPAVVSFTATDSCGNQTICNFTFDFALPVELSSFVSTINSNEVTLNWQTASETNNSRFEIERTSDNLTWSVVGTVAGNGTVSSPVSYSFTDRALAVGTYNYRLKQIDFNGNFAYHNLTGDVVIGVPNKFELMQNYPNPFNPVTRIEFQLPTDGFVNLSIYDMSGKLVSSVYNGYKPAGYYSEIVSAANLSSGVYYYKLQFSNSDNSFNRVMKMVVLK